jgi:DNA-binding Lrp family transcriptional regulator
VADVKQVDIITGPYDLIALVEGNSTYEVLEIIMVRLRQIDGVQDTITCFRVPPEAHRGVRE